VKATTTAVATQRALSPSSGRQSATATSGPMTQISASSSNSSNAESTQPLKIQPKTLRSMVRITSRPPLRQQAVPRSGVGGPRVWR